MTLRVATVLSAREWEPTLVSQARESAAVRIVLRAYQPREIEERADEIDVVVAGAGTGQRSRDPALRPRVRGMVVLRLADLPGVLGSLGITPLPHAGGGGAADRPAEVRLEIIEEGRDRKWTAEDYLVP